MSMSKQTDCEIFPGTRSRPELRSVVKGFHMPLLWLALSMQPEEARGRLLASTHAYKSLGDLCFRRGTPRMCSRAHFSLNNFIPAKDLRLRFCQKKRTSFLNSKFLHLYKVKSSSKLINLVQRYNLIITLIKRRVVIYTRADLYTQRM